MNVPVYTLEQYFDSSGKPGLPFHIQYINGNSRQEIHSHDYFQIIFIDEGEASHSIESEAQVSAAQYSVSVVFPRQIHRIRFDEGCKGVIMMFDEALFCSDILKKELSAYNVDLYQKLNHIVYDKTRYGNIRKQVQQICTFYEDISPIKKEQIRFYIKILLLQLIEDVHEEKQPAKNLPTVNTYARYKELIDQQYQTTKTVAGYAQQIGISAKKLNNICKTESGMTALEVLHERMMVETKRMLLFSGESMKEIAFRLGFASASAFNKFVFSKTGKTPTELKNSLSQKDKQKD